MRRYKAKRDEAWLVRRYEFNRSLLDTARTTIDGQGKQPKPDSLAAALLPVQNATAYGWALSRPIDELRVVLRQGAAWAKLAYQQSAVAEPGEALRWMVVLLLALDDDGADALAERVPAGLRAPLAGNEAGADFLLFLSCAQQGDRAQAIAAAAALTARLGDAATPPEIAEHFAGLDAIAGATAALDQQAFEAALAARSVDVETRYSKSLERRRDRGGLLDEYATAIAALAIRDGLTLPTDDPLLGADLLIDTPPATES